jgi:hypothetical protein
MYQEIAVDMLTSGVDFFVGGGRNDFELRTDSLNYSDSLRNINYNIVYSLDSVEAPVLLPFGALCADYDMPQARERGNFLPDAVDLAIKSLDARGDGFFLMVEGSQIDYQGHGNSTEGVIDEVLDFDRAIRLALDFAERDGETLVVITADHETGGMTILNGSYTDSTVVAQFNTGLEYIGDGAFFGAGVKEMEIPEGLSGEGPNSVRGDFIRRLDVSNIPKLKSIRVIDGERKPTTVYKVETNEKGERKLVAKRPEKSRYSSRNGDMDR